MGLLDRFLRRRTPRPARAGRGRREGGRPPGRGRGHRSDGRRALGRHDIEASSDEIRDLYRSDLDRHLWSIEPRADRDARRRRRRRAVARSVASAVGMLGAAGASYWLYRRLRRRGSAGEEFEGAGLADGFDDDS